MKEQREDNWSKLRQLDADWTEQDADEQHVGEPISFFLWKFSSEFLLYYSVKSLALAILLF